MSSSWLPGALSPKAEAKEAKEAKDTVNKKIEQNPWLPSTLVITHNETGGSAFGRMSKCLDNKKIVWIIIIYAVIATGLWSMFLGNPFQFGKKHQEKALVEQVHILGEEVEELEVQVDRLGFEVTRLSNETDRLENVNDELQLTAEDLNKTVTALSELNDALNITTTTREDLGEKLEGSISSAQKINNMLIDNVYDLSERIETITDLNDELKSTKESLEEEKEMYVEITEALEKSNLLLSTKISDFKEQLLETQLQNQMLSENNEELRSIVGFLNQAGLDLNATAQGIAAYLVEEITENSALVLRDLELSYQNVYFYWMCRSSFEDVFSSKAWMANKNRAIGQDDYGTMIQFVDDNVLGNICANKADFENFLVSDKYIDYEGTIPPVDISLNILKSGVERYATKMMEYYFSYDNSGLTASDWTEYRYRCENIPYGRRYTWTQD